MSDIAIRVDGLSKMYHTGLVKSRHDTMGEQLSASVQSFFQKNGRSRRHGVPFWALKDLTFEVKSGEVLGVIGANGAGKSTLLKILSRITEPTTGSAEMHGRLASLLEVGTGFQAELTGRENIYLNGAILGMRKAEIESKFDEIVAFSEVERFIDTPVKRYSSGMYVRLAFAVAAHLEPEILIIDEVLAVGDASFQKKCLGKINDAARSGRTILFVSHNMGSIASLCARALWLEQGQIRLDGEPERVIAAYLSSAEATSSTWINSSDLSEHEEFRILSVHVASEDSQPASVVPFDKAFNIEISYTVALNSMRELAIVYQLRDLQGNVVWASWDTDTNGLKNSERLPGRYKSICRTPGSLLKPGRYILSVGSHNSLKALARHADVLSFDVSEVGYRLNSSRAGIVTPVLEWHVTRLDEI